MQKRYFVRKLALASMLCALQIVLTRLLGIQSQFFQASFGFTAVATASAVLGPIWGMAVAAVGDILGTLIAGTGAYFPLFTISEILYALVFAFFFYEKKITAFRAALSVVTNTVFISIPLTPLWLTLYFKLLSPDKAKPYFEIFMTKLTASLIELPFKIVVIIPLALLVFPKLKKLFRAR